MIGLGALFVQRILEIPCSIDATFFNADDLSDSELGRLQKRFSSDVITELIAKQQQKFDERFERIFKLSQRGIPGEEIQFAKIALSNVLGGIGYFHGSSVADSRTGETSYRKEIKSLDPLIVQRWDEDLSGDCIRSWLTAMQKNGWIPREQILGIEAQLRFPSHVKHLLIQRPDIANPPTLLLPLRVLAALKISFDSTAASNRNANSSGDGVCTAASSCTAKDNADTSCQTGGRCSSTVGKSVSETHASSHVSNLTSKESAEFLSFATKKFAIYFNWLSEAQAGLEEDTFRWRGRSLEGKTQSGYLLTLASGLDDYPRSDVPNDGERHVDLHAWMTWAAGALAEMTRAVGDDATRFESCITGGKRNFARSYVSILPFMLGLLDPDDELVGTSLDAIEHDDILWSPAGVRSLSASDSEYGKGDNYWTGPVWMPFNFLTLAALHTKYATADGPYRERSEKLFVRLRDAVLKNAFKVYKETGFLWENYSPTDGSGRSGRQFTGW
eukprot:IDg10737t1